MGIATLMADEYVGQAGVELGKMVDACLVEAKRDEIVFVRKSALEDGETKPFTLRTYRFERLRFRRRQLIVNELGAKFMTDLLDEDSPKA